MNIQKLLWWLVVGTKGGINRARIIQLLHDRPYNANQLAETLKLDYKTVRHHIDVLEKDNIVTSSGGEKFGTVYFLTTFMENNYKLFEDIWEKIGEK